MRKKFYQKNRKNLWFSFGAKKFIKNVIWFKAKIQKARIPYILKLKNCLGCAETGSGKTIAFLSKIISLLLKDGLPKKIRIFKKIILNI